MENLLMLILVGKDLPRIVAKISQALCDLSGNLEETSMTRLGGNFTIMLMVCVSEKKSAVQEKLQPVCDELELFSGINEFCFIGLWEA